MPIRKGSPTGQEQPAKASEDRVEKVSFTTTYTGDPSASDVDAVRFEIQDTDLNALLLQDQEISYVINQETGVPATTPAVIVPPALYSAAARCLEVLSERFAAQADTEFGSLKVTYTTQAAQYAQRASEKRLRAQGTAAPWSGGQSIADKIAYGQDADQVQPLFTRKEFDTRYAGRFRRNDR